MSACQVKDCYVDIEGGRIFVRQWTPPHVETETPLILMHDSLGCVTLWRVFPENLAVAAKRPVIAYDRLGFGKSSPREILPSIDFVTEEAELYFPKIKKGLAISRFSILGHSVGGSMALVIAALHDECDAVITESAQVFVEQLTIDGIRAAKELFSDPSQFMRLAMWQGKNARWVLDAWTDVWLSPEFTSWSLAEYLPLISCPVLAIHGDKDEYGSLAFPKQIVQQVRGGAEMEIFVGCGHVPHREQENRVVAVVSQFLMAPPHNDR